MNSLSISTLLTPPSSLLPNITYSSTSLILRNPSIQKSLISPIKSHLSSSLSTTPQNFNSETLKTVENFVLGFDEIESSYNPIFSSSSSITMSQAPASPPRGAEADPMGLLLRERIVFLGNQIDDFVADAIISQLLLLDAQDPTKDIRLFINSPGGSLSATMAIYDVLQLVRADVSTVALGIAASTAAIILGGGTKGKRFAMPNTRIMLHQPLGGASGQAIDVEIQAKEIMHNKNNVTRIISGFTGRTFEQVQKDIDRDRYMSPMEAVEFGIIDGCIDSENILPLMPVPDKVQSRFSYAEVMKDPKKFLTPEIPDDEIY
ncbi:hypothetical protein C5167_049484 [Papaver somniferum]|uniref:ATP-dependent Clp protease proteolytic subunit n=1 Tax=Papaver somniferum TaxID=3469 RepID=A0A4Y7KPG0_PAPSO|nr:ATP-dependent Clp protease proteolytic subunit 4, chloroplastic-like [Papaver somniferum]RZC73998.1 hypothetical protein C5167_049484 [Papaver somniferum]